MFWNPGTSGPPRSAWPATGLRTGTEDGCGGAETTCGSATSPGGGPPTITAAGPSSSESAGAGGRPPGGVYFWPPGDGGWGGGGGVRGGLRPAAEHLGGKPPDQARRDKLPAGGTADPRGEASADGGPKDRREGTEAVPSAGEGIRPFRHAAASAAPPAGGK